jgi:hypothetical protein
VYNGGLTAYPCPAEVAAMRKYKVTLLLLGLLIVTATAFVVVLLLEPGPQLRGGRTVSQKLIVAAIIFMVVGGVILVAWKVDLVGYYSKPKLPPELQRIVEKHPELQSFVEKYNQIQEDMTEQQVESLLSDFPSSVMVSDWVPDHSNGKTFPRKSVKWKVFDSKPDADDCDFFIHVYFDSQGLVVGKQMGEYIR